MAPHVRGSDTSLAAALSVGATRHSLRELVYRLLTTRGALGATDEEIQAVLEMPANTERPRRRELAQLELIVDSGRRRPTLSGRLAVVWTVADTGARYETVED